MKPTPPGGAMFLESKQGYVGARRARPTGAPELLNTPTLNIG